MTDIDIFEYVSMLYVFYPFIVFLLLSFVGGEDKADKVVESTSIVYFLYALFYQLLYIYYETPVRHVGLYSVRDLGEVYGFTLDPLAVFTSVVIGVVASLILYYSIDYMSPRNNYHPVVSGKKRFYLWMYLFVFAVQLFVYSSNLIQMLISFELMSLACWGLISYYGGVEAESSAYKMLVITHLGAYGGLAPAIALLLIHTGGTSLQNISLLNNDLKTVIGALTLWAAVTKSSQFPTYSWLPDAMIAPTPTSALLHGATMIEMGPYLMARTLYYMGGVPEINAVLILVVATFSLVITLLTYPGLRDGKRLLAYSTIAEVAFMYYTVAVIAYSPVLGVFLYLLHFTIHAFVKSLGFLMVGYGGYSLGTHDLSAITELFSGNKLLSNGFTIVVFGLSGIPLFASSKIYILASTVNLLSNPYYLACYLAVFFEAFVFLLISMRIFKVFSTRRSSIDADIPFRMKSVFIILLILLYVFQLNCYLLYRGVVFTVYKP